MNERIIKSSVSAVLAIREISNNGGTKRMEPCQKNGSSCPSLSTMNGCKEGLIYDAQKGAVECPLQRGVITVVTNH